LGHCGLAGILEIAVNADNDINGARFGPEERVTLRCLRREPQTATNRGTGAAGASVVHELGLDCNRIDWDRMTLAAGTHGVLPLVYRRLKSAGDIPREALARMRAEFYGNSLNNLHLARELARLTGLLNARGIDAIAFKGPVLALEAWGDVALRQFNDLDLLVRPADAANAAEVLIAAGYWPHSFDRKRPARSIARRYEDEFIQPSSPWMIDLHWELNPANFSYGPNSAAIWDRARPIRVEGAEVLTLAPNDLVLFLAVHGARHGWINLGYICDFDKTIHAIADSDLPAVLDVAQRSGCLRMLLLATVLAADLLDAPIPLVFADSIRRDGAIASIATDIERRLFMNVGMRARLYLEWVVPLRTIVTTRGRLRYFASRVFTPNPDDFDFLSLPPLLYPLYYAMRPFRLAVQHGRRLFVDVPHPLKRLRGLPR
jgi:hypothetical protein